MLSAGMLGYAIFLEIMIGILELIDFMKSRKK